MIRQHTFKNAFCALSVALACSNSAGAQSSVLPYSLSPLSALESICTLDNASKKSVACISYVRAISDVYFLQHPTCSRPDLISFDIQVERNIKTIFDAIPQENRKKQYAVTVVLQAVSRASPCETNAVPNVAERNACKKGIDVLVNPWTNDYVKQATLEKMRNTGCLK